MLPPSGDFIHVQSPTGARSVLYALSPWLLAPIKSISFLAVSDSQTKN